MIIALKIRGYSGQGFGSGFIKWFTFAGKEGAAHVSLVFVFRGGEEEEFEAIQGAGVIRHPPTAGKSFREFVVPVTEMQMLNAHILACSLVGCGYDWKGIWGFLRRKKAHDLLKWFCSELVSYILYKIGYPLSRRKPYQETPASICDTLRIEEVADSSGVA